MNKMSPNTKKPRRGAFLLTALIKVFLSLLSTVSLNATTFEQQEQRVQQALKAMYNLEYELASNLFHTVLNDTPFHPMGPLGVLAVQYYASEEEIGYHKRNQQFLVDIDNALKLYTAQIQQHPDRPEYLFFYGTVMGLRARIQLAEKNYFGVLTSGYNAIRYIKKAEKLCPDEPDFHLPVGIFNYYVGISAPYMQIASRIMRESGSRSDGLKCIKADADNGNYGRYEARSLLAYLYLYFEENYTGSYEYFHSLAVELPKNPYYTAQTAEALIMAGDLDLARTYIKQVKALLPTLKPNTRKEYQIKLLFLNGSMALVEGNLAVAETDLKEFIRSYDYELDYEIGNAYLRLGNVYDLQKRRPEAIACYRKVVHFNNRSAAIRQAQQFLQQPFSKTPSSSKIK
jgi:tetratricopeptide (TPR) repeat protein